MPTAIASNAIFFGQANRDQGSSARSRLRLATSAIADDGRPVPPAHLTRRQLEVLALLCEGLPNKMICRRLDIAPGTVKAHISSILRELGVASRLQAVVAARTHGLLQGLENADENDDGVAIDFANHAAPDRFQRQP